MTLQQQQQQRRQAQSAEMQIPHGKSMSKPPAAADTRRLCALFHFLQLSFVLLVYPFIRFPLVFVVPFSHYLSSAQLTQTQTQRRTAFAE
jgi:hypothetical protein